MLIILQRRCVHDENGNVDPVKAAETPVPRGSAGPKKRPGEVGSPLEIKKIKSAEDTQQPPPRPQAGQAGVLMPHPASRTPSQQSSTKSQQERPPPPVINEPPQDPQQPEIDPNLFAAYPDPAGQSQFTNQSYPYPVVEQAQAQGYDYPSLEQIANEVLDMGGSRHEDYIDAQLNALPFQRREPQHQVQVHHTNDDTPMLNDHPKPDGSVDSAVSLPNSENFEQGKPAPDVVRTVDDRLRDALAGGGAGGEFHDDPHIVQPSVETTVKTDINGARHGSPPTSKHDVSGLPLYRPPAPLSQSPELMKRQPTMATNGTADTSTQKRKSDAMSVSPNAKKAKMDMRASREPSVHETEDERFAREMHQEQLGLRRRTSRA